MYCSNGDLLKTRDRLTQGRQNYYTTPLHSDESPMNSHNVVEGDVRKGRKKRHCYSRRLLVYSEKKLDGFSIKYDFEGKRGRQNGEKEGREVRKNEYH